MKHYNSLIQVETTLINLELFVSTMRTLVGGVEEVNRRDITNMMYFMLDRVEEIQKRGQENFQILFDEIKNEKPEKKSARKAK